MDEGGFASTDCEQIWWLCKKRHQCKKRHRHRERDRFRARHFLVVKQEIAVDCIVSELNRESDKSKKLT